MDIVLFFEIHQPLRIAPLVDIPPGIDIEDPASLFRWDLNERVFRRVSERVYIKASRILYKSLKENPGFRFTVSVSGIALELMERWAPEAIEILRMMAETERVEFSAQTYYHSLAWLIDREEFMEQVREHIKILDELLGYRPTSAENSEFIYNNDIGCTLASMGFKVVVTEGVERIQGFAGPNHVYENPLCSVKLLLRNYLLSDDIGFRFSLRTWDQYPLTVEKYASWLESSPGDLVFIAMDFETFGEHHWPETGIYEFLEWLPREILRRSGLRFSTVTEAATRNRVRGIYDVPPWSTISWADERDLSAWVGNEVQRISLETLKNLYSYARTLGGETLRIWRLYSMSDHFYYQATKVGPAGEVHGYFNPYRSPYRAQITYLRALDILARYIANSARKDICEFLKRFRAPDTYCFHFTDERGFYIGVKACSYEELLDFIESLPKSVIENHMARGDIDEWVRKILLVKGGLSDVEKKCGNRSSASKKG
ncbi:MAG: glycoside hydrolase family 57 protein [Desulfurococcales archaeon]|jgi:alpha-amylase|nr:glycoside hydrolase family 57 protein [Desulfurococcales archaeon]